jgi:hypothetical protein
VTGFSPPDFRYVFDFVVVAHFRYSGLSGSDVAMTKANCYGQSKHAPVKKWCRGPRYQLHVRSGADDYATTTLIRATKLRFGINSLASIALNVHDCAKAVRLIDQAYECAADF